MDEPNASQLLLTLYNISQTGIWARRIGSQEAIFKNRRKWQWWDRENHSLWRRYISLWWIQKTYWSIELTGAHWNVSSPNIHSAKWCRCVSVAASCSKKIKLEDATLLLASIVVHESSSKLYGCIGGIVTLDPFGIVVDISQLIARITEI